MKNKLRKLDEITIFGWQADILRILVKNHINSISEISIHNQSIGIVKYIRDLEELENKLTYGDDWDN